MERIPSSLEHSAQLNKITAMLDHTCNKLMQAMSWTFDTLTQYGAQTVQGVSQGVKTLFVDVIVRLLNKIAVLVKELYQEGSDHAHKVAAYYHENLQILMQKSNFFQQNFAWRVEEIFG